MGDREIKVGFTKNTAMRHRRVGGRAVTVTAMLHRQKDWEGDDGDREKVGFIENTARRHRWGG